MLCIVRTLPAKVQTPRKKCVHRIGVCDPRTGVVTAVPFSPEGTPSVLVTRIHPTMAAEAEVCFVEFLQSVRSARHCPLRDPAFCETVA